MHGIGYFYTVSLESKCTNEVEKDHELLWLEYKVPVFRTSSMGGFRGVENTFPILS